MKKNQEKTERLNLVLRTVRNVNQLLVKEKERTRLLQGVCDILIENRGYYNAWIAMLDDSGRLVTTAEAGLGEEFLPMVERLEQGELTFCGQTALMQSEPILIQNPFSSCRDCPLSQKYMDRGAMTVRLEHDGKVYGVLCVSIPKDFIADQNEHSLFTEVAGDIAYGLHSIDLEEERKQAAEALLASEKRFRDLVESSPLGICIIQDGRIVYQNPNQERLLGPLPREPKLTDFENIHPGDVEKVKQFHQKITSGDVSLLGIDFRFYPTDAAGNRADMKWVYCQASLIKHEGRDAVLITIMDMTKTKELERLVMIQDKMASLGHVAAGIAHEIRNPLSGINIYLRTLEKIIDRGTSLDKVKEIFSQLQSASSKIESVIGRVMDFSKPSEPRLILTDINHPIEEAINLSSVTLRKSGVRLEISLAEDLPLCYADPHLIEEVILNLINNAAESMKQTDKDKKMGITSGMENKRIVVRLFDSGPGVPIEHRENIFDPFYTTKEDSSGIGLSICRRIVTDHGGVLGVKTSKYGGAEFVFKIPIKSENGRT